MLVVVVLGVMMVLTSNEHRPTVVCLIRRNDGNGQYNRQIWLSGRTLSLTAFGSRLTTGSSCNIFTVWTQAYKCRIVDPMNLQLPVTFC